MPTSIYNINRKHTVNDKYFNEIQTEKQAYWLGFLWADGSINKTAVRCSGKNRLTVSQKLKEKEHLQLFAKDIQSDTTIRIHEPYPNNQNKNIQTN